MGGVTAIFNLDGRPVDRALFERMHQAIAYRGPDGSGHWLDGPVALGNQRHHTTPEAVNETQPLADTDGRLPLALDGRVGTREALAAALRARAAPPADDSP